MNPQPCATCGKELGVCHRDEDRRGIPCGPLICVACHKEKFWREHAEAFAKGDPAVVIVDGVHYRIGHEGERGYFRGFGGSLFRIRFKDGRRVDTTNLWHQGDIPEHWRDRLPDNAEFIPCCGDAWVTPERAKQASGVQLWCGKERGHAGLCTMGLLGWTQHGPLLERSKVDRTYSVYKEAP